MTPISSQDGYLQGQLLVATPNVIGSCFSKSVIYLCNHGPDGAMGMIVNHHIAHLSSHDILSQLEIDTSEGVPDIPVHFGGPVEPARGFVIHTADYTSEDTVTMDDHFALTSNVTVLRDLAQGHGPQRAILVLGYAGWGPGQLEDEIESNSWISVPATDTLLFGNGNEDKWEIAARSLGIDMSKFSSNAGHA